MDSLVRAFLDEARLLLHRMDDVLRKYEKERKEDDLDAFFRDAHTLKSSSQAMGHASLSRLFHDIESVCEASRAASGSDLPIVRLSDVLQVLLRSDEKGTLGDDKTSEDAWRTWRGEGREKKSERLELPEDLILSKGTYERLMGAAESIFSAQTRIEALGASLLRALARSGVEGKDTLSAEYQNAAGLLHRSTVELDRRLRDARMTPLSVYFDRIPHLVRDLNERLGKRAVLSMEGGGLRADRLILSELGGPLEHLVRNAIDHGIEQEGKISVNASLEHDFIVLTIEDTGKGIAYERIEAVARERGIIPHDAPLSPDLRGELLFHPHLSTKTSVTDISGRGIGMSAVREYVRSVGGRIRVESPTNEHGGTRITLRVPTALSLARILLFRAGHATFGIVERALKETLSYDPLHVREGEGGQKHIHVGERVIPLVSLSESFGLQSGYFKKEHPLVLVVEGVEGELGILVDVALHEEEVLVKALPKLLAGLRAFTGAAMIGDGRTVLILDPLGLSNMPTMSHREDRGDTLLSPMDKDQLMEVMNVVASHAGGAIARRLGKHVELSIPEFTDGGAGLPEDDWGASAIGVRMVLEGAYPGHLLFEMPAQLAGEVTEQVLGKKAELHELTQEERAFFQELGHIAMHAIGNMLSRISKNPVMTKASDVRVDARGALRSYFLSGHQGNPDDLVRVRLWFGIGEHIRTDDHRGTGSFTIELRREDARVLLQASRQALAS